MRFKGGSLDNIEAIVILKHWGVYRASAPIFPYLAPSILKLSEQLRSIPRLINNKD